MSTPRPISQSQLKSYRKLHQKKYRDLERKFVVEGKRSVAEAIQSGWSIEAVLATSGFLQEEKSSILKLGQQQTPFPVFEVSEKELEDLSDAVTSQGVAAIVHQSSTSKLVWRTFQDDAIIVALDRVGDPGNIGTIIRTCDWFGVNALILGSESAELYNPKVVRSTMGSIFHLRIFEEVELPGILRQAKEHGFRIIATTLEIGKKSQATRNKGRCIFVFGSEAHGLSGEILALADECLTIPRFGEAESLNVAIACGITLAMAKMPR